MRINRIWDNNGRSFDRYTVEFEEQGGEFWYLGIGDTGNVPNGFCMVVEATPGPHLGERITFNDMTLAAQKAIENEFRLAATLHV
jgi:hypothetical protein